jgi:hypothetical protein
MAVVDSDQQAEQWQVMTGRGRPVLAPPESICPASNTPDFYVKCPSPWVWPVVSGGKYRSTAKLQTWRGEELLQIDKKTNQECFKGNSLARAQLGFILAHCEDSVDNKHPVLKQMLEQQQRQRLQSLSTSATKLLHDFKQARAQWWFGLAKCDYKDDNANNMEKRFMVRKLWDGKEFVAGPLCVSWDDGEKCWNAEAATSCLSLYRGTINIENRSEVFRMYMVGFYSYIVNVTNAIQSEDGHPGISIDRGAGLEWIVPRSQDVAKLKPTGTDKEGNPWRLRIRLRSWLKKINNTLKHADTEQVYKKTQQQEGQQQAQPRRISSMHAQAFVFMVYLLRHCGASKEQLQQWARSMQVDVAKSYWLTSFLQNTARDEPVRQRLLVPYWMAKKQKDLENTPITPHWDNIHGSIDRNCLEEVDKAVMTYILRLLSAQVTPY